MTEPTDGDELSPGLPMPDGPLREPGLKALHAERVAREAAENRERQALARVEALEHAERQRAVGAARGLTDSQCEVLVGRTQEELAAHCDQLIAAFKPENPADIARSVRRSR